MFLIYTILDRTLLKPEELNLKNSELLYEEIILAKTRHKYIGKILLNHGIAITIKKLSILNNAIIEVEGVISVEYEIELVMFQPKIGDILYGKIIDSDENFILVDCEIIKVKVPVEKIMKPREYIRKESVWLWKYGEYQLFYDIGEEVKLKVIEMKYKSTNEINTFVNKENTDEGGMIREIVENKTKLSVEDVMEVLGSMGEEGLGPMQWWK